MKSYQSKLIFLPAGFLAGICIFALFGPARQPAPQAQAPADIRSRTAIEPPPALPEFPRTTWKNSSTAPIGKIDFGNFKYPGIWRYLKHPIILKKGELEFEEDDCGTDVTLEKVVYQDLTNDGEDEALVILRNITACGSSGMSIAFFALTMRNNRPQIIWQLTTGSEAHGGLKDFWFQDHDLVVELYGRCRIADFAPVVDYSELETPARGSDWAAKSTTRFRFGWNGRQFGQQSLEVLPFPYQSIFEDKTEKSYEKFLSGE